jgi:PAS domain S-box-containing protein
VSKHAARPVVLKPDVPDVRESPGSRLWLPPLRILLPVFVLFLGILLIVIESVLFLILHEQSALENVKGRAERQGNRIARLAGNFLSSNRQEMAEAELNAARDEPGLELAALIPADDAGAEKTPPGTADGTPDMDEVSALLATVAHTGKPVIQRARGGDDIIGVFPVESKAGTQFLALVLDLSVPLREARRDAGLQALIGAGILGIGCLLLWVAMDVALTRRVKHLVIHAGAMAAGRDPGPQLKGFDEMAEIDRALRAAHSKIAAQAATLRASEERYRNIVENIPALVAVNRAGVIEFMNAAGLKMLGYEKIEDMGSRRALDLLHPDYHEIARERTQQMQAGAASVPPLDEKILRSDGSSLDVEVVASSFTDERGPAIQVVMWDISERKTAELRADALALANAERSRLEQEIIKIAEREQRRIGQDLHDDLCQRLAAVKMKVQELEEKIAEEAPGAIEEAEAIARNLGETIAITRALARGLSPVDIESGGLAVALAGLARSAKSIFGIECRFETDDALPKLGTHAATQLYRIAQECITNAAKHAKARHATISLRTGPRHTVLRVSNDGAPLITGANGNGGGMGAHIMRYRAESMGATIEIEPNPADAVTAILCKLPLNSHETTLQNHTTASSS